MPALALPPATPFTLQITDVSLALVTVAVNCCVWPVATLAEVGDMLTRTGRAAVAGMLSNANRPTSQRERIFFEKHFFISKPRVFKNQILRTYGLNAEISGSAQSDRRKKNNPPRDLHSALSRLHRGTTAGSVRKGIAGREVDVHPRTGVMSKEWWLGMHASSHYSNPRSTSCEIKHFQRIQSARERSGRDKITVVI